MSAWDSELQSVNGKINRIKAFELFLFLAIAVTLALAAATAFDVWLRPRGWGRWLISGIWASVFTASIVLLSKMLNRRRTTAAVAAFLESKFPQLDNHLINCVLFERESDKTPWLKSYIKSGAPEYGSVDLAEIKNRKRRKYGAIGIFCALLLLVSPAFFLGNNAWGIAIQRTILPFADIAPPMFTRIVSVTPGNATVIQGSGADVFIRASGRSGQRVIIEVIPDDDRKAIMDIGKFDETDKEQTFSYHITKVATSVRYRFLAGDAYPTEEYQLTGVPPLSAESLKLAIRPPANTKRPAFNADLLGKPARIPDNSEATVSLRCNRTIKSASVTCGDRKLPMNVSGSSASLKITIRSLSSFTIEAQDEHDLTMTLPVRFEIAPDAAPEINMISPSGKKAVLPPGAAPVLHFEVKDDYGLKTVRIERVKRGASAAATGEVIKEWALGDKTSIDQLWKGTLEDVALDSGLRVVAWDNSPATNRTVGPLLIFAMTNLFSAVESVADSREGAKKSLGEIVSRQKRNLTKTERLRGKLPEFDIEQWEAVHKTELEIRTMAAMLIKDPTLGKARLALNKAIAGPFAEAVSSLAKICTGKADMRSRHAMRAVTTQKQILDMLGVVESSMNKSDLTQTQTGLITIIDGILKGQTANLAATIRARDAKSPKIAESVIEAQDNLAQDIEAMVSYCSTQVKNDASESDFMKVMKQIADKTVEMKLHEKMVDIAEKLDSPNYPVSIPDQISVTNSITGLRNILLEVREEELKEQAEESREVVEDAAARLEKIRDAQKKLTESLRNTGSNGDKSAKIDEDMLEEIAELREQLAEATLKVATDLQNIPDAEALNDLVTDVYRTYEEMKESEFSAKDEFENRETGLQKEDWVNDLLNHGVEKMKADEMETWLLAEKDSTKRNTEAIDKEEMVADAVGKVLMPEELQDQIGELLSEEEKPEETDDSVTNQGVANPELGWGVSEGEYVDYSAAGKSGNTRPDHKDQDGRSQTGRQGQSDGEFVGATAAIGEGDDKIEKRRTKDSKMSGKVEEEGHADAVATGGGKAAGYSQEKGMTGDINTQRQNSSSMAADGSVKPSPLTREYEAVYAQAQRNGLPSRGLGKVAAMSRIRDMLRSQKASPKQIDELTSKIKQELKKTYSSLETSVSGSDMGASGNADPTEETLSASPEDVPAEYREMVSDYFKALDTL